MWTCRNNSRYKGLSFLNVSLPLQSIIQWNPIFWHMKFLTFWSKNDVFLKNIYVFSYKQSTHTRNHSRGSLQLFSQDYDLVSHITYVVYVNFNTWLVLTYSLKSIPNDRFLRNFSWNFCQKSVEKKSLKKYFVTFRFVGDT